MGEVWGEVVTGISVGFLWAWACLVSVCVCMALIVDDDAFVIDCDSGQELGSLSTNSGSCGGSLTKKITR